MRKKSLRVKSSLLVAFFVLLSFCNLYATTYYISNDGDDKNTGTSPSSSWQHAPFMRGLWQGPSAETFITAGDSILFKSGDEWRGNLAVYYVYGLDNENRITISSYGEGPKPILNGSDVLKGLICNNGDVYEKTDIAIHPEGIFYTNDNGERALVHEEGMRDDVGINEWDYDDTTKTLYVNVGESPINGMLEIIRTDKPLVGLWSENRTYTSQYITVENLELKKATCGITIYSQFANVKNCTIHDMEKTTGQAHPQGIFAASSHNLLIEKSEIYNIKFPAKTNRLSHGIYIVNSNEGIYRYNKIHDCLNGGAFHFFQYNLDGSNYNLIHHNLVYNNRTNFYLWNGAKNNKVLNNVFWDAKENNIDIYSMETKFNEFKNNVFGNSGQSELQFHCKNEINCSEKLITDNTNLDYNAYYHSTASPMISFSPSEKYYYEDFNGYYKQLQAPHDKNSVLGDSFFVDPLPEDFNGYVGDYDEICDDGIDNNGNFFADCDDPDCIDDMRCMDLDGDGYSVDAGDCNDADAAINPDAEELCDNIDNNCDGKVDNDMRCRDIDGDGYFGNAGDCNDADAAINPDAEELCDNKDNNCDNVVDKITRLCGKNKQQQCTAGAWGVCKLIPKIKIPKLPKIQKPKLAKTKKA